MLTRKNAQKANKSKSRGKHGRKSQRKAVSAYTMCILTTILYNAAALTLQKAYKIPRFRKKPLRIYPV